MKYRLAFCQSSCSSGISFPQVEQVLPTDDRDLWLLTLVSTLSIRGNRELNGCYDTHILFVTILTCLFLNFGRDFPRLCLVRNVIDMQLIIPYLTKHPVWVTNPVQNKLQGKPLGKHGFFNLLIVRLVSLIPSK